MQTTCLRCLKGSAARARDEVVDHVGEGAFLSGEGALLTVIRSRLAPGEILCRDNVTTTFRVLPPTRRKNIKVTGECTSPAKSLWTSGRALPAIGSPSTSIRISPVKIFMLSAPGPPCSVAAFSLLLPEFRQSSKQFMTAKKT